MKTSLYLSLLLIVCAIAGCNKNEGNANWQAKAAEAETYRIKKHIVIDLEANDTTENYFTYNTDNSIATESNASFGYTYTYGNGVVLKMLTTNSNVVETYHLNSEGFTDTLSYDEYNFFTFQYNSYGNVIKKDFQGLALTYNWTNGNLSSAGNGGMVNFDFITDKFSTINSTNKGALFAGRESVNIPSRGYNEYGDELIYTYEFDNLDRVIRRRTQISDEYFTYY